jgi:hypothetical protein
VEAALKPVPPAAYCGSEDDRRIDLKAFAAMLGVTTSTVRTWHKSCGPLEGDPLPRIKDRSPVSGNSLYTCRVSDGTRILQAFRAHKEGVYEALEAAYRRLVPPESEKPAGQTPGGNGQSGDPAFGGKARSGLWGVPYEKLTDDDLVRLAGEARNGAKFRALMNGDTGGYGGDDSAADMALCMILAFWCRGDAVRVDRLFRGSRLFRPKWDERHFADGRTHGQGTVGNACAAQQEHHRGPGPLQRLRAWLGW